jgi:hypothetical protein
MDELLGSSEPSTNLLRSRALVRLDSGEALDVVARESGIGRRHLMSWLEAIQHEGLAHWLKKKEPGADRLKRARSGIAQMFQGQLAEEHF